MFAFERCGAKSEVTSLFMQAANLGDRFVKFTNIGPSALYALAAPSIPEDVRNDVAELGPCALLPGQVRVIAFAGRTAQLCGEPGRNPSIVFEVVKAL